MKKKNYLQSHESHQLQKKGSFVHPNKALETFNYSEYVSSLQKERQIRQKSKVDLPFFCKKTLVKASSHNEIFLLKNCTVAPCLDANNVK